MMIAGSLRESFRISNRSFMQSEQFNFPKDLLQEIGFPYQSMETFTFIRASPAVSLVVRLEKCVAK